MMKDAAFLAVILTAAMAVLSDEIKRPPVTSPNGKIITEGLQSPATKHSMAKALSGDVGAGTQPGTQPTTLPRTPSGVPQDHRLRSGDMIDVVLVDLLRRMDVASGLRSGRGTALSKMRGQERFVEFCFLDASRRSHFYKMKDGARGDLIKCFSLTPARQIKYDRSRGEVHITDRKRGSPHLSLMIGDDFHPDTFSSVRELGLKQRIEAVRNARSDQRGTCSVFMNDDGIVKLTYRRNYGASDKDKRSQAVIAIDTSNGCHLISYETKQKNVNGPGSEDGFRQEISWKRYGSVWYVSRASFKSRSRSAPDRKWRSYESEVEILDFAPNVTIDESQFNIDALRVPIGIRVFDHILGTSYRHKPHRTAKELAEIAAGGRREEKRELEIKAYRNALVGKEAPAFPAGAQWLNSKPLTWRSLRGKVVILDFWAIWCVPCRLDLPVMSKLHRERAESGIVVIGIHTLGSKVEDIQEMLDKCDLKYPICVDTRKETSRRGFGALSSEYGEAGIPYAVVIDQQGKVAVCSSSGDGVRSVLAKARKLAGLAASD